MDENASKQSSGRKKSGSKVLYIIILLILIAVFLVSAGMLIKYFIESRQSQQTYNELKDIRGTYTRPTPVVQPTVITDPTEQTTEPTDPLVKVIHPETGLEVEMLPQFADLYQLNPDLVGWISIPGTRVDYPVVQRPETQDYYLYRDFYGKYDSHGCIYVREVCDVFMPSDNITMYGHRMKDNTMFADLSKLQSKEFLQEHPYIYFDTLTEYHTYEVVYVLTTSASVGQGFAYHELVDAANEEEFNSFLANCQRYSLFDTGVTASYGDKLITLSTCEYTHENGRLVVVAKRID